MKNVWIVDDDRSIRWVLEKALSREGLPWRSFENAIDVQNALENETPCKVGGVTVNTPSCSVKLSPRRVKTLRQSSALIGMPMTLAARATRSCTGLRTGMLTR